MKRALIFGMLFADTLFAGANVATIGGKALTEQEFRLAVQGLGDQAESIKNNPEVRIKFLEHIIDTTLISAAASADKIEDSAEFKQRMLDVKKEILGKVYWDRYLKEHMTEAQVKTYFTTHEARFSDQKVRASHILLPSNQEPKAKDVLAKAVAKGADFAQLVQTYSTDPTKKKDGDLGFFGRGRMLPEFEAAAFATAKDTVHPNLVKTSFGFHIIRVTDIQGAAGANFVAKRAEVERDMERELREELRTTLRTKTTVQVNLDAVKKLEF